MLFSMLIRQLSSASIIAYFCSSHRVSFLPSLSLPIRVVPSLPTRRCVCVLRRVRRVPCVWRPHPVPAGPPQVPAEGHPGGGQEGTHHTTHPLGVEEDEDEER